MIPLTRLRLYAPNVGEGKFYELRLCRVLRISLNLRKELEHLTQGVCCSRHAASGRRARGRDRFPPPTR
jgi:hypothetical protein